MMPGSRVLTRYLIFFFLDLTIDWIPWMNRMFETQTWHVSQRVQQQTQ